jgi:hypothetical protein
MQVPVECAVDAALTHIGRLPLVRAKEVLVGSCASLGEDDPDDADDPEDALEALASTTGNVTFSKGLMDLRFGWEDAGTEGVSDEEEEDTDEEEEDTDGDGTRTRRRHSAGPPRGPQLIAVTGVLPGLCVGVHVKSDVKQERQMKGSGAPPVVHARPLDPGVDGVAAGYGDLKTGKTQFDPAVRAARALTPDRVVVTLTAEEDLWANLGREARSTLFPHATTEASFTLTKVNVYGPGDHFARHVDTPAPQVHGTLVITCPRTQYGWEGGEGLVLYGDGGGDGDVAALTLSESSARPAAATYTMFYSDVVHEVKPCATGHRVSLTYSIMFKAVGFGGVPASSRRHCVAPSPEVVVRTGELVGSVSMAWMRRVRDIITAPARRRFPGDNFAVLCANKYSFDEIEAGVLKGFDGALVAALRRVHNGWRDRIAVVPVALRSEVRKYTGEHAESYGPSSANLSLFRMTRSDLQRALRDPSLDDADIQVTTTREYVVVVPHISFLRRVSRVVDPGAEHTGNEARPMMMDSRYWAACIVMDKCSPGRLTSDDTCFIAEDVGGEAGAGAGAGSGV